ncbi:uncharacterized protein K441DRAFT_699726 [Cenococcum geophilum 1.58]|uniref:uncharacterized protein n=1 Tax=Cenococcum geophilum 1.58 TaxID=794803 RepID=UPI00358EF9EF|nr:hypothetical protein K441DRAFT_699726 [Cenococcum geophilum 1.58]
MEHTPSIQPNCSASSLPPPHQQTQSLFFALPAELRNEICRLVFSTSTTSPHALSLLQTCRRIYMEAHLLAFSTVTFSTKLSIRYELAQRTHCLSPAQFNSITNIAFTACQGYENAYLLANFLANTISLFPRLKKVRLLVPKISKGGQTYLSSFPQQVPDWLGHAISLFISGRPLAWQASELWTVSWPQQVGNGQCVESSEVWDRGEYGHEARQAQWTTCCLKQKNESQRTVRVECQAVETQKEMKYHELKLRELEDVAEQLPLRVVNGGLGLQWDGETEWWTKRKYKRSFFSGW